MTTTTAMDVIQRLEGTPGLLRDNWCVPHETGRFLSVMALTIGAKNICEVGTSVGYSTLWLARAAQQTGGTIDTLEYFEERQQQAKAHIAEAGYENQVRFHLGQAIELLQQLKTDGKTFDFAFIDAAKKEYIEYVRMLETMMPSGAILIADNTKSHRDEMQDFLAYMEASTQFDVAEIESPNGQLLARKR
jgi:predicted O-methyltransferase YrrM